MISGDICFLKKTQVSFEKDLKTLVEERKIRCQQLGNGKLYYIEVELKKKGPRRRVVFLIRYIFPFPAGYSDELGGKAIYTL